MYNIKTLNKISPVGLSKFDSSKYIYGDEIENPDASWCAQPPCMIWNSLSLFLLSQEQAQV